MVACLQINSMPNSLRRLLKVGIVVHLSRAAVLIKIKLPHFKMNFISVATLAFAAAAKAAAFKMFTNSTDVTSTVDKIANLLGDPNATVVLCHQKHLNGSRLVITDKVANSSERVVLPDTQVSNETARDLDAMWTNETATEKVGGLIGPDKVLQILGPVKFTNTTKVEFQIISESARDTTATAGMAETEVAEFDGTQPNETRSSPS
jgi:hypothetical protein